MSTAYASGLLAHGILMPCSSKVIHIRWCHRKSMYRTSDEHYNDEDFITALQATQHLQPGGPNGFQEHQYSVQAPYSNAGVPPMWQHGIGVKPLHDIGGQQQPNGWV